MPGKTTARGLGWPHQRARAQALEAFVPGTLCRYCRRPMHRWQGLDLDHLIPRSMGGIGGPTMLAHARCNRGQGARIANARARRRHRPRPAGRRW